MCLFICGTIRVIIHSNVLCIQPNSCYNYSYSAEYSQSPIRHSPSIEFIESIKVVLISLHL